MAYKKVTKKIEKEMAGRKGTKANKKKYKKYGYRWTKATHGVNKGKWGWWQIKPKKKGKNFILYVPKPASGVKPPDPKTPVVVKTTPTVATYRISGASNAAQVTSIDLTNQFAAMAAVELWQYTNKQAVEGIFSDVKLIAVLSEIRERYNPNDMIDSLGSPFIKSARRTANNELVLEIDGAVRGRAMLLEFYLDVINLIKTGDYV